MQVSGTRYNIHFMLSIKVKTLRWVSYYTEYSQEYISPPKSFIELVPEGRAISDRRRGSGLRLSFRTKPEKEKGGL